MKMLFSVSQFVNRTARSRVTSRPRPILQMSACSLSKFVNRTAGSHVTSRPRPPCSLSQFVNRTARSRVTSRPRPFLEMSASSLTQQFVHLTSRHCVTSYFPEDRRSEHFKITNETMLHSAGVLTPEPTQFITQFAEFFRKIFLHFQKYREKR
jgi:hypothetical protein